MTSIVITAYHANYELIRTTIECLDSLRYGKPDEIILVDDCSPLPFEYDGITIIRNPVNLGYAGTVNVGWAASHGDIIINSNNDIVFNPGWLDAITQPLYDGYDIMSICTSDQGWETRDEITEGDRFGSLWAQRRDVYEQLGGYDETLGKSTFEDTDYWKRATIAGFKIGKNWSAVVEHEGRKTMDVVYPDREDFVIGKQNYLSKWDQID